MSPGATMERVYMELKARAMRGEFAPGERLDPVQLSRSLSASATPVRDALHRLSGERLIDSWHQEGFRQPILTEADLNDLYAWANALLALALSGSQSGDLVAGRPFGDSGDADYPAEVGQLFRAIGWRSENRELRYAIANLVDRTEIVRSAELRADPDCRAAVAAMDTDLRFGRLSALRRKITSFHRKRALLAGRVVAELRPREQPLR